MQTPFVKIHTKFKSGIFVTCILLTWQLKLHLDFIGTNKDCKWYTTLNWTYQSLVRDAMGRVEGKTAVITAAGQGIGRARLMIMMVMMLNMKMTLMIMMTLKMKMMLTMMIDLISQRPHIGQGRCKCDCHWYQAFDKNILHQCHQINNFIKVFFFKDQLKAVSNEFVGSPISFKPKEWFARKSRIWSCKRKSVHHCSNPGRH